MTEILTESFCERCGTRYTFESAAPRRSRVGRVRTVSRGLRNFVLSDESSLSEAMADARSDEERSATTSQLDAFHKTFNFCLTCRQYTCGNCWNTAESRCLTCMPLPGMAADAQLLVVPAIAFEPNGDGAHVHGDAAAEPGAWPEIEIGPEAWPEADVGVERAGEAAAAAAIVFDDEAEGVAGAVAFDEALTAEFDAAEAEAAAEAASSPYADDDELVTLDEAAVAARINGVAPGQSVEDAVAAYEAQFAAEEEQARHAALAADEERERHAALAAAAFAAAAAADAEPEAEVVAESPWEPVPAEAPWEPAAAEQPWEPVAAEAESVAATELVAEPEPEVVAEELVAEPEAEIVAATELVAEPEPEVVAAELVAEPEAVVAELVAEPEPEIVAAEIAAEPEPEIVAEPEPVLAAEPEPDHAGLAAAALLTVSEPEPELVAAEPEPVLAAEPEPDHAGLAAAALLAAAAEQDGTAAAREDVVAQPTWPVAPVPDEPATPPVVQPAPAPEPAQPAANPWLTVAPDDGRAAPEWPVAPSWGQTAATRNGQPATLAGRPLVPQDNAAALWAASAREVLTGGARAPEPTAVASLTPQPCVSCGLSLSANARFCRRCGTRQG